jgi:benzoyl-CoA reductase subunit B
VHQLCNTEVAWVVAIQQLYRVPTFVVEVPYIENLKDEPRHFKTMVSRLREFVAFIEQVSGRPYNWARLQEMLSVIKKAATLRDQGLQLGCRTIPAPGTFFDWAVSLGPINYLAGRPETVGYYEQLKAEIEDRIAKKIGAVPDEKYRVMWEGVMFWLRLGSLTEKFAAANCAVISGSYTHLGFWPFPDMIDPEKPMETIANYLLGSGIRNRPPAVFQDYMVKMCKDYSLDGVMMAVPHTCRPLASGFQMLGDRLRRDLGIPVVEFQGDQSDPNFYSDLRTNYAVDALLEAIASAKKR